MARKTNPLAASMQVKSGRLYAVMQVKQKGKTKPVWRTLGLPADAPKSQANKIFREVVRKYEEEYAAMIERDGRPDSDIPVFDYLCAYLKKAEPSLQKNTVQSYRSMIYGKIKRYFTNRPDITVGNLTAREIQNFYDYMVDEYDVNNNTIIHYHAIMRKAFHQAFKEERIDANPFDRVDRPKKDKFRGANYIEDETRKLLEVSRSDSLYPAIMFAVCMGMRRSEALGVRWSRIDWEQKTVLLDTKIVEYDQNGKTIIEPQEEMKNESSRRTLILPEPVYKMLLEEKEKQELYQRMFKSSYKRTYKDYVCVDSLGEIISPGYATRHFSDLLKKNGLRHIRFHDLRHTFASLLIANGVPLINVSNFLGHSDLSTTANIYAHLDKESKQKSADIISDILGNK